jgi:hypothetical protein
MSAELAWGELDVLHPLLVRAVQCTESLMTQLQQARDQAAIAGPGRPLGLISSAILPSRHIGLHLEPRGAALSSLAGSGCGQDVCGLLQKRGTAASKSGMRR